MAYDQYSGNFSNVDVLMYPVLAKSIQTTRTRHMLSTQFPEIAAPICIPLYKHHYRQYHCWTIKMPYQALSWKQFAPESPSFWRKLLGAQQGLKNWAPDNLPIFRAI